jgi:putative transposase
MIRYDPRDMAEIRVYHQERFLCRAVCQELAGETMGLKDILHARRQRKRELQHHLRTRQSLVDQVLAAVAPTVVASAVPCAAPPPVEPHCTPTLKRYYNE